MNKFAALVSLVVFAIPVASVANEIDGKKEALCATIETVECTVDRQCQHGVAGHVNMPTFFRIDFKKKKINATPTGGKEIVSEVKALDRSDGKLFLSGVEGGRGWSMVIDQASGGMTLTLAGLDASFVVFGACTIP